MRLGRNGLSEYTKGSRLSSGRQVRSSLPPEPDRERAEKLCVKMISEYHGLTVS